MWSLIRHSINDRDFIQRTNRRITFEWALIQGETDQPEQAHELGKLLKGFQFDRWDETFIDVRNALPCECDPLEPHRSLLRSPNRQQRCRDLYAYLGLRSLFFAVLTTPSRGLILFLSLAVWRKVTNLSHDYFNCLVSRFRCGYPGWMWTTYCLFAKRK